MSENDNFDERAYGIAVASVRRHCMDAQSWRHTVIGEVHFGIGTHLQLIPGERAIASGYLSNESWWVVSTRRIMSRCHGSTRELDPRHGIESAFGNFKGFARDGSPPGPAVETATITSMKRDTLQFEYETGKASMAPIYACMFWARATSFHYATRA